MRDSVNPDEKKKPEDEGEPEDLSDAFDEFLKRIVETPPDSLPPIPPMPKSEEEINDKE